MLTHFFSTESPAWLATCESTIIDEREMQAKVLYVVTESQSDNWLIELVLVVPIKSVLDNWVELTVVLDNWRCFVILCGRKDISSPGLPVTHQKMQLIVAVGDSTVVHQHLGPEVGDQTVV